MAPSFSSLGAMRFVLLRFLAGHLVVGVTVGWTLLGLLLALDIGGLWTLISASPEAPVALVMLAIFFAITFGSLAMGSGLMGLGRPKPPPMPPSGKHGGGGHGTAVPAIQAARRAAR